MEGGRIARNGDPRGPLLEYDTLGSDISLMYLAKYVSLSVFSAVTGGKVSNRNCQALLHRFHRDTQGRIVGQRRTRNH